MRQVIRQIEHMYRWRSMALFWPCSSRYEDMGKEDHRNRSLTRRTSRSVEECRRHSSMPPSRTYQPIGREFMEDTIMRKIGTRSGWCPRTFRAGNLLLDVIWAESGMPFMRVRPREEGVDAFLFSSRRIQGFFRLRQCSDLSAFYHERINRSWQREEGQVSGGVHMDEQIWLVHSRSGSVDGYLPYVPNR